MNTNKLPEVGDRLEIETNEGFKNNLISQIMDIIDENNYFISTPIVNNTLAPIPVGEIIKVNYAKKDYGVYYFKARVISRKNINNISYIRIERLGSVSKNQRRNFFRLEILLNVNISIKQDDYKDDKIISTLSKDISGGGIRLISKEPIKLQSLVDLTIDTKTDLIKVKARVVRCSLFQYNEYDLGLIFEDISEFSRSKIISFIFEEQRKMRQKGLI